MAKVLGLKTDIIGKVGGNIVKINDVEINLDTLRDIYFNSFKKVIEQDI